MIPCHHDGLFAVLLPNVFSKEECKALIEQYESEGQFSPATINVGGGKQEVHTEVRNHSRFLIDDAQFANEILWERIRSIVETEYSKYCSDVPVGLNERLRVLRYEKNEYFNAHYDLMHRNRETGTYSLLTVMLYLNETFTGGTTVFLDENNIKIKVPIIPETGAVLIFDQDIYHKGEVLEEGIKYVLRTDVMFQPKDG